jgi:hypothetical protein
VGPEDEIKSVHKRLATVESLRKDGMGIQARMLQAAQEAMDAGDEAEARAALMRKRQATKMIAELELKMSSLRNLLVMLQVR